jgi:hypothetical protein
LLRCGLVRTMKSNMRFQASAAIFALSLAIGEYYQRARPHFNGTNDYNASIVEFPKVHGYRPTISTRGDKWGMPTPL